MVQVEQQLLLIVPVRDLVDGVNGDQPPEPAHPAVEPLRQNSLGQTAVGVHQ
jgi:hypothetical protein